MQYSDFRIARNYRLFGAIYMFYSVIYLFNVPIVRDWSRLVTA